jgi:NADH:ubiquinone oxidoreductase subunit 6 (subunit J)
MEKPFESIVTLILTFVGVAGFVYVVRKRTFWRNRITLKLTATFCAFYTVFSIPGLLSLTELHSLYGIVYCVFNFPVILLIDGDEITMRLFGRQTLETSNMAFAIVSIAFWSLFVLCIGTAIDITRHLRNKAT